MGKDSNSLSQAEKARIRAEKNAIKDSERQERVLSEIQTKLQNAELLKTQKLEEISRLSLTAAEKREEKQMKKAQRKEEKKLKSMSLSDNISFEYTVEGFPVVMQRLQSNDLLARLAPSFVIEHVRSYQLEVDGINTDQRLTVHIAGCICNEVDTITLRLVGQHGPNAQELLLKIPRSYYPEVSSISSSYSIFSSK
jgi:hypothetical protein